MFDFEKLHVYIESKKLNKITLGLLQNKNIDQYLKDQLKRAGVSILLNIAEWSGRFTKADKRNFYIIARGSLYETIALIDILKESDIVNEEYCEIIYSCWSNISKMLTGLINSLK